MTSYIKILPKVIAQSDNTLLANHIRFVMYAESKIWVYHLLNPLKYNPQNEMFSPCKTKCSKSKTKCLRFSTLQNHIKNSVRTAFLPNSNAISISTYQCLSYHLYSSITRKAISLAFFLHSCIARYSFSCSTSLSSRLWESATADRLKRWLLIIACILSAG